MKLFVLFLAPLFFLTGCGYRSEGGEPISVSIPYVIGDYEGELTDALVWAFSRTSQFRYTQGEGDWRLEAKVLDTVNDRIGYRYDRDDKSGKLRSNVIGTENRRTVSLQVSVINATTGCLVWGPHILKADGTYDYVDTNSLQDLSFVNQEGIRQTSIAFSLGQLDSVGAAGEEAIYPIYRKLAQKIVDGLMAAGEDE